MENICSTIEIGKNLCDLTGPWVGYLNNLDTNMETLKRKTEQLNGRNNDINVEVNYAEQRSRKKRRVDVECWQEYVQRITADVQTLERQEQEVRGFKNAFKRAHLGKRVVDKIEEVEKLYENGEFSNGLLIDDPTCGHAIPTAESLVEPTSVRNREKIWNFLMDDAVRKIGVHGMGGIGKTTIMGSINNQLLSETSTFSDVIWVTVSKAFDIKNLQGQIAKKLNIALSDNEDELRSASEINKMLSQKKRTKVKVSAEELLCLKQLEVLEAQFHNVQELTMYVNSAQCKSLEKYSLEVGIVDEIKNERLTCEYEDGSLSSTGVDAVVLPSDIWKLYIRRWHNHISLSHIQSLRDARGLGTFIIEECDGLESIFSSSSCFSEDYHIPLTTIEELEFSNLPNFRVLFDRVVPPHNISFNLKRLVLCQCPKMENIFSALLLHNFPNLEELEVQDCKNVEEIIAEVETSDRGGHREDDGDTITLPNLKILNLLNLPRLESIYKGIMVCESLQHISISNCPMLRRLPISLHKNEDGEQATAPPALRFIFVEEERWESLEWDNPLTKTTLQPFCCPAAAAEEEETEPLELRRRRKRRRRRD
ncbi:hypothetical protein TEA_015427 [Camellia sinensis var. sinensis]|uniref:Uncharacterized protein n=1 Tax=Camellia sinensis var. sinensis TaxID=542762 RepID=A0A4S4D2B2_CAMSN|nr:hypothetical protein TEA_015427 [Camellia sinensis var. sinensis]